MTPTVRGIIHARRRAAGKPQDGWVGLSRKLLWYPTRIYEPHLKAIKESGVRPFVFYNLRHTFLTRLGESGVDAWTLMRIAGHSSIKQSVLYCHSSDQVVHAAMKELVWDGYKTPRKTKLLKYALSTV
jgi:integrase